MASNNQTRLLNGGIESDRPPFGAEPSEVLHSLNMHPVIQGKGGKNSLHSLPGNIAMMFSDVLPPGPTNPPITYTLLGKCVYEPDNVAYLFFHASSGPHRIIRFDGNAPTVFFRSDYTVDGIGWTADTFISAAATDDLLIFTDGVNDVRYLNRDTVYSAVTPMPNDQLSLIPEPGAIPLQAGRNNDVSGGNLIQTTALQFTYIFTNTDNIRSVMAPFSLTALPARESQMATLSYFWNVVTIILSFRQKIPTNWKSVEFVVRYLDSNTFFIIRRWSKGNPADETAVANHNSLTDALKITNWNGTAMEALDAAYAAKQFDALPRTADVLTLSDNRLFLGNVLQGYDTPVVLPSATVTLNSTVANLPSFTSEQAYVILSNEVIPPGTEAPFPIYFAIVLRIAGVNYLLPRDYSFGLFNSQNNIDTTFADPNNQAAANGRMMPGPYLYNLPSAVAKSTLIRLQEQGDFRTVATVPGGTSTQPQYGIMHRILNEAHDRNLNFDLLAFWMYSQSVNVIDDPDESTPGGNRAFLPGNFDLGIQYYDGALRKSGVLTLTTVTIPPYGPFDRVLVNSLTVAMGASSGAVPVWAKYYSITKTASSVRYIQFVADLVKVALINDDKEIKFAGYPELVNVPTGWRIYGLAINMSAMNRYGYSYEFNAGDKIEMVGFAPGLASNTPVISGSVIATYNGYVIMQYSASMLSNLVYIVPDGSYKAFFTGSQSANNWTMTPTVTVHRQSPVYVTLYTQVKPALPHYEIAAFGQVNLSGGIATLGNFFVSLSLTTVINGDSYTQKRVASAGAATGIAITPYEPKNLLPVTDSGRVAGLDRIGQQELKNVIAWSNIYIPSTNSNGYGNFDAQDYKTVDIQAGGITALVPTTKGIQEGGQMVVLCTHGSFVALVGQQQVKSANGSDAFTVVASVLGSLNPIAGGRGMQTYRAFDSYQGSVWWVDAFRKEVVEFNSAGAGSVSRFGNAELFKALLSSGEPRVGVNPYSTEVLVSMPQRSGEKPTLPTTNLPDPLFAEYRAPATYVYNWEENRWSMVYLSGAEFLRIGNDVYGWKSRDLWKEFQSGNSFYGDADSNICFVTVPFNQGYPKVIQPQAIAVTSNRPPDFCWIVCQNLSVQQIAITRPWSESREGVWRAAIMRDRLSDNAVSPTEWDASNFNGASLKGDVPIVVLGWNRINGMVEIQTATLEFTLSSGQ